MCADVWVYVCDWWLSDASDLSASQTSWCIRACGIAVQPLVPLHTSSVPPPALNSVPSLWVIGLGARALYLSQSPSFTLTLMTITHWPPRLLSWSLPLPSLLRRLLACTHRPVRKIHPSKTSTGFPGTDTYNVIILILLFLRLLGHSYQG